MRPLILVKTNFSEDIYLAATGSEGAESADDGSAVDAAAASEETTDESMSAMNTIQKPDGIEYSGTAAFPQAEKFTFDLVLSADKSKVLYLEILIENLKLEQKSGNTINTYQAGRIDTVSAQEYDIQDGTILIETDDFKLHAKVLDSCIYGAASYTYTYEGDSSVSIDLGLADTLLENRTNPGSLPKDLTDLLQQFKEDNNY